MYGALSNFLDMYSENDETVLVLEAIANGLDARARNINIIFEKKNSNYFIKFANDGPGMTKEKFIDYHTISLSSKKKGEGIGFAGVGAKIYLASEDGTEILTITKSGKDIYASKMYRNGKEIQYDTSLKKPLESILGSMEVRSFIGTLYQVKLNEQKYYFLKNNILKIIEHWYNLALLTNSIRIFVKFPEKFYNIEVKAKKPEGKEVKKIVKHRQEEIPCYFYVSDNDIHEDNRHIVYVVYGKRIYNESIDFIPQIVEDKRTKVFGIVDVTLLSKFLLSNKEGFEKNLTVGKVKQKIKQEFFKFLKSEGLISDTTQQESGSNEISNEFTKSLSKLLQMEEFKFLNPWINLKTRTVVIPEVKDGDTVIKLVENGQKISGGGGECGTHEVGDGIIDDVPSITTVGNDEVSGYVPEEDGDYLGKEIQKKAKGLSVIEQQFPHDPREGWLDQGERGVVYNKAHPFAKKLAINSKFSYYNLARVVISSLIKEYNDKAPIDAKQGLEFLEKALHASWI